MLRRSTAAPGKQVSAFYRPATAHRALRLQSMLRSPVVLRWPVVLLIGACATGHDVAKKGRELIIGMDAKTLQSCAGIPTRTTPLDPQTELYSYEIHYESTGGMQITLPIIGGGFKAGGSGSYCHAIVRIVAGKVAGVNYTGDNDEMIGREGVCAPIFRGCLRAHEKTPEARTANRAS
jgi:hypothetical protein